MPYLVLVPDEVSKPFWDAVQQRRLIVQHCTACNSLQYPPRPQCQDCESESLDWKETSGRGHILTYGILEDSHLPVKPGSTEPATRFGCRGTQTGAPLKLG